VLGVAEKFLALVGAKNLAEASATVEGEFVPVSPRPVEPDVTVEDASFVPVEDPRVPPLASDAVSEAITDAAEPLVTGAIEPIAAELPHDS
jgi:hypothetical protein